MDLLLVVLLLLAVGVVVAVALNVLPGGLAPAGDPLPPPLEAPVQRPGDLDRARFALALRGYRMDQVDAVLDEARDLLAAKDEEIGRLRRLVPAEAASLDPAPAPVDADPADPVEAVDPADPAEAADAVEAADPVEAPAEPIAADAEPVPGEHEDVPVTGRRAVRPPAGDVAP